MTDWNNPDQRESAIAAKWAQAEDQIKVQEARIAELEAALLGLQEAYNTGSQFNRWGQLSEEAKDAAWFAARAVLKEKQP
jgi:hypothetical protein